MLKAIIAFVAHHAGATVLGAALVVGAAAGATAGVVAFPSSPPSPSSASLPSFQPQSLADWYAIGDSYISGEGTANYYSGTDGNNDYCHRSPDAYAPALGVPQGNFFACSGATIDQIRQGFQTEGSQVDRVATTAKVILLSAGGDSLNFAGVLQDCVDIPLFNSTSDAQCRSAVTGAESTIPSVRNDLVNLLQELHQRAPDAWIVLVGYPRLFPESPQSTCTFLDPARQEMLNEAANELDSNFFQPAVSQVTAEGLPVWFVDTLNSFSGHELCDSQQDLNQLTTNGFAPTPFSLQPINLGCHPAQSFGPAAVCVESFHPDTDGYAQLQQVVTTSLGQLCALHCPTGVKYPPPPPPPPTEPSCVTAPVAPCGPAPVPAPTTTTTTSPPATTTTPPTSTTTQPTTTTTTVPTPPTSQGTGQPGHDSPGDAVAGLVAGLQTNNVSEACSYTQPSEQATCNAFVTPTTSPITNFGLGTVQIQGTQALVVVTGGFCDTSVDACSTNTDPNAGLDPAQSFAENYQAALGTQNEPATGQFVIPCVQVQGQWYVTFTL